MSTILSSDATIADVLATLAKPESYVRGMLENLYECKGEHGSAESRIGITGGGKAPNYRVEFSLPQNSLGLKIGILGVFDGRTHKPIEWIEEIAEEKEEMPVKDEHWSSRSMTLNEVARFLGQIRRSKRDKRR